MKNFLLVTCLVISNFLIAQKITFGPEVGINLISIENTELGNNYQLGYHFGGQINYHFSDHFSLNSGLYLSQKKKKYNFTDTSTTFNAGGLLGGLLGGNPDLDDAQAELITTTTGLVSEVYLEIPVTAKYEIKNISFFGGGYVGFLLSANRKQVEESESNATDVNSLIPGPIGNLLQAGQNTDDNINVSETNSKNGLNMTDVGLMGGIGYRANHLNFNLTYSYGLFDYRSEDQSSKLDNHKMVRFSITYLFGFKTMKKLGEETKTVRHL